ncbi:MAG: 50S ribosomal protein L18 [Cyanobacteria bacterium REEB65]|nr:50S ribosomal protein L18 [Cyanobacteria bacterium REEB65]
MITKKIRKEEQSKRHRRLRVKLAGTAERPRLAIFRSQMHIYAQVIDDDAHKTLVSTSSVDLVKAGKLAKGCNVEAAGAVGEAIAKKALDQGIKAVVYDRGGFLYHGRIAALADKAREAGLEF